MNTFDSEDQQVEAIKKWWKENGVAVVVGIVVGVGGLVGWRSWSTYVDNRGVSASVLYEEMSGRQAMGDVAGAADVADHLVAEYDGTGYADLARLAMARIHYGKGESDDAIAELSAVRDGSALAELRNIAGLRLARIHLDRGESELAERALAGVDSGAFTAVRAEIRGDILAARGDVQAARDAYADALSHATTSGNRVLLQMKLDDLGPAVGDGDATS